MRLALGGYGQIVNDRTLRRALDPYYSFLQVGDDGLDLHAFEKRYFTFVTLPIFCLVFS